MHEAVNWLAHSLILNRSPDLHDWSDVSVTVLALAITLVAAFASWHLFEKRILRFGHGTRYAFPAPVVPASAMLGIGQELKGAPVLDPKFGQ